MIAFRPRPALVPLLCLGLWPGAAAAHPHVFIDAGLRLIVEEGRVTAVEVTWLYDELYSLILLEDYGLDPDFDLALTEAETAETLGFDLNWNGGFEGGLTLMRGDAALAIGAPEPVSLALVGPGHIRTTHRRAVTDPGGSAPLEAQIYDAAFYIAFEMTGEISVDGAECDVDLVRADLDAAYEAMETALAEIGGAVDDDDNFPAVGSLFADRVRVACAG